MPRKPRKPRKPVRGRFSIVVPISDGGSWSCETLKDRYLTPAEIADALEEYAAFIRKHFCREPPIVASEGA